MTKEGTVFIIKTLNRSLIFKRFKLFSAYKIPEYIFERTSDGTWLQNFNLYLAS